MYSWRRNHQLHFRFNFAVFLNFHCWSYREIQPESGALAWPITMAAQRTLHLLCRQRPAVKAKSMTVFFGGEAVPENARKVFRRDADTVVPDGDRNFIL